MIKLWEKLKMRRFERKLHEDLKHRKSKNTTSGEVYIHKVGILFSAEDEERKAAALKFEKHLKKRRMKVHSLTYVKEVEHPELLKFPAYTKKDVRRGIPSNESVDAFLKLGLDLLICAEAESQLHFKYITALSDASLKVGLPTGPKEYLDIIIDVGGEDDQFLFYDKAEKIINNLCPIPN